MSFTCLTILMGASTSVHLHLGSDIRIMCFSYVLCFTHFILYRHRFEILSVLLFPLSCEKRNWRRSISSSCLAVRFPLRLIKIRDLFWQGSTRGLKFHRNSDSSQIFRHKTCISVCDITLGSTPKILANKADWQIYLWIPLGLCSVEMGC